MLFQLNQWQIRTQLIRVWNVHVDMLLHSIYDLGQHTYQLHAVYFIRDTVEFQLVVSLKISPNLTSYVS